jgi:hypothetical protein
MAQLIADINESFGHLRMLTLGADRSATDAREIGTDLIRGIHEHHSASMRYWGVMARMQKLSIDHVRAFGCCANNDRAMRSLYAVTSAIGHSLLLQSSRDALYRWFKKPEREEATDGNFLTRPMTALPTIPAYRTTVKRKSKWARGKEILTDAVHCEFIAGMAMVMRAGQFADLNPEIPPYVAELRTVFKEIGTQMRRSLNECRGSYKKMLALVRENSHKILCFPRVNAAIECNIVQWADTEVQLDHLPKLR